jgi:hypothetical protein
MRPTHHGNQRYQRIGRKRYRVIPACTCSKCARTRFIQTRN